MKRLLLFFALFCTSCSEKKVCWTCVEETITTYQGQAMNPTREEKKVCDKTETEIREYEKLYNSNSDTGEIRTIFTMHCGR